MSISGSSGFNISERFFSLFDEPSILRKKEGDIWPKNEIGYEDIIIIEFNIIIDFKIFSFIYLFNKLYNLKFNILKKTR